MEFIINTDLEKSFPAVIDFNFEELKAELSQRLTHYGALVVTADTIKDGKEERAKLNKVKAAVEDRRKEVKKLCLAPYEAFETKCKELTGMIDKASGSIDAQVKAFEEAEKAEKREALESAYAEHVGDLDGLLPFERIFSPKWLNKTVSLTAATDELRAAVDKARNDIKVIRAMRCACEDQTISTYLNTLDMSAALAEKSRYEARQEQLSKMRAAEAQEPDIKVANNAPVEQTARPIDLVVEQSCEIAEERRDVQVIFRATTAAFRAEMKSLTARHNIEYEGVQSNAD